MTLKARIVVTGDTESDLGYAIDEARRLIVDEERTSGMNSNDSGSFTFDVEKGDAVPGSDLFMRFEAAGWRIADDGDPYRLDDD